VESDPCDRPLAPYAASKRAAELLGFTYHHLYGLDVTVPRFFTVYGPRGRPDMMAYKVADSIFLGRNVPLFNNGQMYRDWTYVGAVKDQPSEPASGLHSCIRPVATVVLAGCALSWPPRSSRRYRIRRAKRSAARTDLRRVRPRRR